MVAQLQNKHDSHAIEYNNISTERLKLVFSHIIAIRLLILKFYKNCVKAISQTKK